MMKSLLFLSAFLAVSALATTHPVGANEIYHAQHGGAAAHAVRHRRALLAARSNLPSEPSSQLKKRSKKCKTKKKTKTTSSGSSSNTTSTSGDCPSGSLSVNGVCIGMLPDGGSDGGSQDTMATLNNLVSSLNKKHAYFGQYAQATGTGWTGGQLTQILSDLKSSGAIFQPAVMPTGGWSGLTSDDNSLAQDICNVMKTFTDQGIEVWLRFAHEVNWYQTDGTYKGTADDFKEGWDTVAKACKQIAPDVKMFFTPNVASLDQYEQYFPTDPSTVDIIGVDYYPKQGDDLDSAFVQAMQPFHDKYCSETTLFAIGETGLGWAGSSAQKVQWMSSIANSRNSMQYMKGVSWFNYDKGYNFKIVDPNDSGTTDAYVAWAQGN